MDDPAVPNPEDHQDDGVQLPPSPEDYAEQAPVQDGQTYYDPNTGQYYTVQASAAPTLGAPQPPTPPTPPTPPAPEAYPPQQPQRGSLYDPAAEAAFSAGVPQQHIPAEQFTPPPAAVAQPQDQLDVAYQPPVDAYGQPVQYVDAYGQPVQPTAHDQTAYYGDPAHMGDPATHVVPPAIGAATTAVRPKQDNQVMAIAVLSAIALHVVIIAGLAFWIIQVFEDTPPPLIVQSIPTQEEEDISQQVFNPTVQPTPASPSSSAAPVVTAAAVSSVAAPPVEDFSEDIGFGSADGLGDGLDGWGSGAGGGFQMPPTLNSRCSKADREKRLMEGGGLPESQVAVINGLRWLKKTQNGDGSWGQRWKVSMTGLALLSFLGHCETPDSPEFGEAVLNGILFLAEQGMQNEGRMGHRGSSVSYEHAIATYALAEAYTMSRYGKRKIHNVLEVLNDAVPLIIRSQSSDGGWYYSYESTTPSDTSVSGWNIQALNAARHTGVEFEGMEAAWENIAKYCTSSQNGDGHFGYRGSGGGRGFSMTGVGCLGMIMHGGMKQNKIKDGADYIIDQGEVTYDSMGADLYGWYYVNQVMFMRGGGHWKKWNGWYQDDVIAAQNKDGSFKREGPGGDIDAPVNGSLAAGPDAEIYRTTLCILMLEVYYRYLPATDTKKGGAKSGLDRLKERNSDR